MQRKVYFENLDGLRFFCFLAVFFYHSFHTTFDYIKTNDIYIFLTKTVFANGNLGVNCFFVLSGFLITYLLIEEKRTEKNINVFNFWMRRILRIWPLFFFCVFFGFIIFPQIKIFCGEVPSETAHWYYYLCFLNNFDFIYNGLPDASILGVLWSVAIEEQFYLLWPIVLWFIPEKKYWIPFCIVILTSLVFRAINDVPIIHEHHTFSCMGDLATGALGAWLAQKKTFLKKFQNCPRYIIIMIYVILVLIFIYRKDVLQATFIIRIFERIIIAFIFLFVILEQCFAKNSLFKIKNGGGGKVLRFNKLRNVLPAFYRDINMSSDN